MELYYAVGASAPALYSLCALSPHPPAFIVLSSTLILPLLALKQYRNCFSAPHSVVSTDDSALYSGVPLLQSASSTVLSPQRESETTVCRCGSAEKEFPTLFPLPPSPSPFSPILPANSFPSQPGILSLPRVLFLSSALSSLLLPLSLSPDFFRPLPPFSRLSSAFIPNHSAH